MSILNVKKKNSGEKDNLSDYNDDSKRMEMDRGESMAIPVGEFSSEGYKIRKVFG